MQKKLRIAIQKSGRLSEISLELLKECGIHVSNGKGALVSQAANFPLEVFFLRDDDIPDYVADGTADLGIVGENVAVETEADVALVKRLDFGKCRLSLAVPKGTDYQGITYFEGKRIATSYPNILKKFLAKNGVSADVHQISGSVEIAPGIGLADAICDLVSSGSTLLSNGLKEVQVLLQSEAVMIATQGLEAEKQAILDKLIFRLNAVMSAKTKKYVVLNAPNGSLDAISTILPGMRSPTIVPLATEGWSAVHSVLDDDTFWEVIDDLKDAGAEGILVVPIEKMIV
ncbi:MAG: ATP phosphoribosyltransferase [Saprospiraceae bacterium]|nr:ATP phosphoribosyltransferase [Saprospiraceae bacterium]